MTGCPNGCARPYMAELGLVADGPNSYQVWLGAAANQSRLAETYQDRVKMQVQPPGRPNGNLRPRGRKRGAVAKPMAVVAHPGPGLARASTQAGQVCPCRCAGMGSEILNPKPQGWAQSSNSMFGCRHLTSQVSEVCISAGRPGN